MTELHLHLDGSMRPQTIFELASHQSIALPPRMQRLCARISRYRRTARR